MTPAHGFTSYADYNRGMIEQIRRQIGASANLATIAAAFLRQAYPHVSEETIATLARSWYEWTTCGAAEQIAELEKPPQFSPGLPEFTDGDLVELFRERQTVADQLEALDAAKLKFPVEGMADVIEASIAGPIRARLAYLDERISKVQGGLERRMAAAERPEEAGQ